MKIINEPLLASFRSKLVCEWCKRQSWALLHPHHIFARGMGGGGRIDVPINLIALCAWCHNDVHAGLILRVDLLAIVAQREGRLQDEMEREIRQLRRPRL